MVDAFSLATGIAGLLSLCLQVTKDVDKQIRTLYNAPKEATELLGGLQTLSEALQILDDFVARNPILFIKSAASANPLKLTLTVALTKCEKMLKQLDERSKLLGDGGLSAMKSRVRWFLDKDVLLEKVEELQRFAALFGQCMSIEAL
jgi:hypothetical protein